MKKNFVLFNMLLLLSGCSTTQPTVMKYTSEAFQPTQHIEIFHIKPPARDYIEIGEVSIRLKKSTQENAVALLSEKAKELGADALVIIGERSKGAVAMPVGSLAVAVPLRELYGIAIKYK
jgi:type IV pilus biogenesis protein CpaD/CtpE